jgi:hypothetical protein
MPRMPSRWLVAIFGFGVSTLVAGPASAGPTTQFTVTGDVAAPTTYALPSLQALPPTTEMVTFQTMSGPQTGTFTGPTLWSLLNTVGLQTPAVKNGILRQYVIAGGSDGYTAIFSLAPHRSPRPAGYETGGSWVSCCRAVDTEVGVILVRASPSVSRTRNP